MDLQRRYDEQYGKIEDIEIQIEEVQSQIRSIRQEKISGDNIYQLLLAFDEVYNSATEAEQKEFMKAFIERIELFPEKRKDGCWIKNIVFNFPVPVNGDAIEAIARFAPRKLVYVSCDPATLARDVALLKEKGFKLQSAQAFDLFPRCAHVETVVTLSKLDM